MYVNVLGWCLVFSGLLYGCLVLVLCRIVYWVGVSW